MGEEDDRNENNSTTRIIVDARTGAADCAEGGADSQGILTPIGTTVPLAAFKSVYLGLAAGEGFRFPAMDGTDLHGQHWSGSYSMLADGPRFFKGENLTRSREVVTLQSPGGVPTISISTKYFHAADGAIFQIVFSSGVTYFPVSQCALPSLPRIGDSGTLGTLEGSDDSTVSVTWELKPAVQGCSILEISSTVRETDAEDTATEFDRYVLDSSGVPRIVSMSATTMGSTVNLTGSRAEDRRRD